MQTQLTEAWSTVSVVRLEPTRWLAGAGYGSTSKNSVKVSDIESLPMAVGPSAVTVHLRSPAARPRR